MFAKLFEIGLDQIGNLNPQLMREWQGRLRWRNLLLTLLISSVVQVLFVAKYLAQLPNAQHIDSGIRYCLNPIDFKSHLAHQLPPCEVDANGLPLIDWPLVWGDIFSDLSYLLFFVLIVGGLYLLVADLSKETRQGTLTFLRMSPQSSRSILLGKLLGVPVLLYVGIGLMLPLHFTMGLMAGYPLTLLLAFYGLLGAIAVCFYTASLWFGSLTTGLQGFQPWLISGLGFGLLTVGSDMHRDGSALDWARLFDPTQLLGYWKVQGLGMQVTWPFSGGFNQNGFRQLGWFFWPVGQQSDTYLLFALANALILGGWFWVVLERKFQAPGRTALGKLQSYGLTLYLAMMVMGFNLQARSLEDYQLKGEAMDHLWSYPISMLICSLILMCLLLPSQQSLLDWTRYRHQPDFESQKESQNKGQNKSQNQRSTLLGDLLQADAAPPVLAFGINLVIMMGVLFVGIGLNPTRSPIQEIILQWSFSVLLMLNCVLILQWIALSNALHWRWLAFGVLVTVVVGWPTALSTLGISTYEGAERYLWLTTAFPQALQGMSWQGIGLGIATHLVLITTLGTILTKRLQHLGQSEWKA